MRNIVISLFFFAISPSLAQCPTADFEIEPTGCIEQNFYIQNNSAGSVSYEWDFCSGDFQQTPGANAILTNSVLNQAWSIRVVYSEGNWFGFAISVTLNKLFRFDFGASLDNVPSLIDLGNPSNLLSGSTDLHFIKEGYNWYAFASNANTNRLLLLSFGATLSSSPAAQDLGTFGVLNTPNGISIVKEGGNTIVFVANGGISEIIRLNFGASVLNTPTVVALPVSGGVGLRGLAIVKECDRWYGLVLSYNNNKVFSLDFNNGLQQPFQSAQISFFSAFNFPATVTINHEGGGYYAFIQSAVGPVYRLSYGSSIIDGLGTGIDLGHLGISDSNSNFAHTWVNDGTHWFGFSIDRTLGRLIKITLPVMCEANPSFSTSESPVVSYLTPGSKNITQTALNSDGSTNSINKVTTISSNSAPDINFTTQNICVNHDVNFTSQNSSDDIVQYDWDFGDANSSNDENPVHQYTSNGEYNVELVVTALNGCKNLTRQSITLFNEPIPDFTIPSVSPLCTNQNFLFGNISSVDPGYTPAWGWSVNGISVSTAENLYYTFENTVNHEIKLTASIPGCETEMIKNINMLVEGPQPDFTVTGQCEEVGIAFTNTSTGEVTEYAWNFGDGGNSVATNPNHVFSDPDVYDVILTATNAAGCNNTISKPVTIYSIPQVNFTALLPPFSCSGTATQFNNLTPNPTDSNIASWLWDFGDTGSSENTATIKNPQHTYAVAGEYGVTLTVTTNFLCESTLQLPVTISQSPIPDFNFTPTCEDVPVEFTDATTGTIQSWSWQIGSSFYSMQNPTHTFSSPVSANVMLTITADNNCISSITKPIVVPDKLNPDFSVSRNCIEQQTLFTDITNDTADPVMEYAWDFAGLGSASISPAQFVFSTIGDKSVMLTITTETGCKYSVTKSVNVIHPPQASFTALPNSGPQPLEVQFTNTSVGAEAYEWNFNDSENSVSSEVSPAFAFEEAGEYGVRLVAYNSINCSDTTTQQILVSPITGIDAEQNFYFKTPYPNPARENLFLGWTAGQSGYLSVRILDAVGKVLQMSNFQSNEGLNEAFMSLSGLKPGVYFIQMRLGERERAFRVIVKQE